MSTKPLDSAEGPGPGAPPEPDIDAPDDQSQRPAAKSPVETVLPPSAPEIVRVRTERDGGGNPFLRHFVDEPREPDPLVRPKAAAATPTAEPREEPVGRTVEEALDQLDESVLTEDQARFADADAAAPAEPAVPQAEPEIESREPEPAFREYEPEPEPERAFAPEPDPAPAPETAEPPAQPEPPEADELPPIVPSHVPEISADVAPALPYVRFARVQKSFDGRTMVVKALELDVQKGEFLTLLGPSGSGKTTTLMMLAGFEQPSGGEILIEGEPISHMPPHKRNIGMVFQNYALFPHMTVAENLAFPLKVRGLGRSAIKDNIARALRMVSLEGFEKRWPHQLSGGQQQRVAVARALVFSPSLVLMDEPLGALDRHLREQMQFEIKRLHRELGLTVVYVTHDQSEALTLSDRIAVFHDGQIQQAGSPEALYVEPANAFVAGFVGENNKMSGSVEAADAHYALIKLDGGQLVKARRRDCGGSGSRATVTVRPEHVQVAAQARSQGDLTAIAAHVVHTVFQGDHLRMRLSVPGGGDLSIKTQSRSSALPGDTVYATFHADDAFAFMPMEKA
jgi:putative spermidine/putrescine transport system ATP-binding protein